MEKETGKYGALRFTAGVIIAFGWLWLIVGWLGPFIFADMFQGFASRWMGYSDSPSTSLIIFTFTWGIVNTILAMFVVAYGQLLLLLIEMRDDLHTSMRALLRKYKED